MGLNSLTGAPQLWGACSVRGADGVSTAVAGFWRVGAVSATARTGAGVYTVTLGTGVGMDTGELLPVPALNVAGAAALDIYAFQTTDNNVAVTTFAGGAAADENFKLMLWRVRVGT